MEIYEHVLSYIPQLMLSVAMTAPFFLAWIALRTFTQSFLSKGYSVSKSIFVTYAYKILSAGLTVLAFITLLSSLGIDPSSLVAGLGLTGLAFSVTLKDFITSALSGALILFNQPFRIGSHISVMGVTGRVIAIDIMYTKVETSGQIHLIPNSKIIDDTITIILDPDEKIIPPLITDK